MLEYDFDSSPTFWVCMTSTELQQAFNEELAPHGITFRQSQVLGWLSLSRGELTQAELAEKMHIEAPTLVGILDRMERDGWIVRHVSPADRRKKLIRPTPRVEPVWATIVQAALRVRTRAVRGLSKKELETLKDLLQRLRDNLSASRLREVS